MTSSRPLTPTWVLSGNFSVRRPPGGGGETHPSFHPPSSFWKLIRVFWDIFFRFFDNSLFFSVIFILLNPWQINDRAFHNYFFGSRKRSLIRDLLNIISFIVHWANPYFCSCATGSCGWHPYPVFPRSGRKKSLLEILLKPFLIVRNQCPHDFITTILALPKTSVCWICMSQIMRLKTNDT